jgi:hypothetical protein
MIAFWKFLAERNLIVNIRRTLETRGQLFWDFLLAFITCPLPTTNTASPVTAEFRNGLWPELPRTEGKFECAAATFCNFVMVI